MEAIPYAGAADRFPVGMRVLVVDDDPLCLMILKKMLQQCKYDVTTCNRAIEALQLLRERTTKFDLVMSDVYMPDIDGFKLLELIGLEMDLPVIMMSANGETSVVMKGITHGACDYLLKPVRLEELRNIWQHVVRKRVTKEVKEESSGEWEDSGERTPDSASEQSSRKRKEKFDVGEEQIDSLSGLKKPRVVWSGELHRLFVNAVNQLGVESKLLPSERGFLWAELLFARRGGSEENPGYHERPRTVQGECGQPFAGDVSFKYRLGLKRLSGVDPEPHPVASFQADESGAFGGTMSIQPASSKTSTPRSGGVAGGVFGKGLNQLDPGTLAALKQLQAMQQANQARVLKGPRAVRMRQTALGHGHSGVALQRTCSVELGSLMEDCWTSSWQHQQPTKSTTNQSAAGKAEVDMFSSSSSSLVAADLQAIAGLKDVRLEEREQGSKAGQEQQGDAKRAEELPLTTTGELASTDFYFASSPSPYAFGQHVFTQQDSNWLDY